MKKSILYIIITAAIAATTAIAIIGCGDFGTTSDDMNGFLERLHYGTRTYTVTYDGNGSNHGNAPKDNTHYASGDSVTVLSGDMTRDGFTFSRWTTEKDGGGDSYEKGKKFPIFKNVTLYAQWNDNNSIISNVVVVSEGIGASGEGSYSAGTTVRINAGEAPAGKQFQNWMASPSVTFASSTSPITTFTAPSQSVTIKVTANFVAVAEGKNPVTVSSIGVGVSGNGSYTAGATVSINAGGDPFEHRFQNWTTESDGVIFTNANSRTTTFTMPGSAVTVTANFVKVPVYAFKITTEGGTGASKDSSYREGDTVTINAGTAPADKRFKNWTVTSGGVTLASPDSAKTKFVMPANAVAVTANFQANTFTVTVSAGTGATGGGDYYPGKTVTITAGTPPTGFVFKGWSASNSSVTFADANSATTTFIMPSSVVTVSASYEGTFTDGRDKKQYKAVTIGGKMWMAENLNYQPSSGNSWCYGNADSNCVKYGRLYDWNTAMTACPTGWHLPTRQEWGDLAKAAGGTGTYGDGGTAGTKLKSTSGWYNNGNGTDDFGFSALPGSYRYSDGSFNYVGYFGFWWTATEYSSSNAYYRTMDYNYTGVSELNDNKSYAFSVRCLRD